MPLVTIVIPTYNRASFLAAAVASVLAQSEHALEVIIVDDGSTDETPAMAPALSTDPRVKYVRQDRQGRSAARNTGARLAESKWLVFLDSDDQLLPRALAEHLAVAQRQSTLGMTIGGYVYTNAEGFVLGERRPWLESGLGLRDWLFNCLALPASAMIRRDWFEKIQGFDPGIQLAEDWDLFLRLAQAGCPMTWTPVIVCQYQQHSGNSIHNLPLHRDSSLRVLDKVLQLSEPTVEMVTLTARAKAWVHVIFARRAFAAGQSQAATADLHQAMSLDPRLGAERRLLLLEYLFSLEAIGQQVEVDMESAVTAYLPASIQRFPVDIRHAQARAHMAAFFRAHSRGAQPQARAHLQAAIQRDARWLLNRGVWAYCARQLLRRELHVASA